jgi:hypothetical protein
MARMRTVSQEDAMAYDVTDDIQAAMAQKRAVSHTRARA